MRKPIRVVFTANGEPARLPSGDVDEKLWTAGGHHWLESVDGEFPYEDCETRYVERGGPASIVAATPA